MHGGYTHANWLYSDNIVKNVTSFDFTSSYPYVLVSHKFPMSEFKKCNITDLDNMLPMFAYLIRIKLKNVSSKQFNTFLSKDKCRNIKGGRYDNGRIIKADELETTITDVDFNYLKLAYNFEYEVIEIYYSNYSYLPKELILFILDKYVKKTQYKNVEGKEYEYSKEKSLFNSIYGMAVTNNIRSDVIYDNTTGWREENITNEEIEKRLKKEKNDCFMSFAWGVWCTSYARSNLIKNIIKLDKFCIYRGHR